MRKHAGGTSKGEKETFLALVPIAALAVTIIVGVVATSLRAQSAGRQESSLKRQEWETLAGGQMTFDVASVKPSKITSLGLGTSNVPLGPGDTYPPNGGLFSAKHFTLIYFIMFAYKIASINDLRGIPDWVTNDHFDIEARAKGNPSKDQMRLMVQSVLVDRFKLAMRTESQTRPTFALVLSKPGKTGPQLQSFSDDGSCATAPNVSVPPAPRVASPAPTSTSGFQLPPMPCGDFKVLPASAPGRIRVGGKKVTMTLIARQVPSGTLAGIDRPVFDRTGLSGTFNFIIEWTPRFVGPAPLEFTTDEPGPTFTEALEEQLGLKLEPTTGLVDILVIDQVERPSPN